MCARLAKCSNDYIVRWNANLIRSLFLWNVSTFFNSCFSWSKKEMRLKRKKYSRRNGAETTKSLTNTHIWNVRRNFRRYGNNRLICECWSSIKLRTKSVDECVCNVWKEHGENHSNQHVVLSVFNGGGWFRFFLLLLSVPGDEVKMKFCDKIEISANNWCIEAFEKSIENFNSEHTHTSVTHVFAGRIWKWVNCVWNMPSHHDHLMDSR